MARVSCYNHSCINSHIVLLHFFATIFVCSLGIVELNSPTLHHCSVLLITVDWITIVYLVVCSNGFILLHKSILSLFESHLHLGQDVLVLTLTVQNCSIINLGCVEKSALIFVLVRSIEYLSDVPVEYCLVLLVWFSGHDSFAKVGTHARCVRFVLIRWWFGIAWAPAPSCLSFWLLRQSRYLALHLMRVAWTCNNFIFYVNREV